MNEVYVLSIIEVYDYIDGNTIKVFKDFESAYDEMKQEIEWSMQSMEQCVPSKDIDIQQTVNRAKELAKFEMSENGDYTKNHCKIEILKMEVE